jgi:hypothetical protein
MSTAGNAGNPTDGEGDAQSSSVALGGPPSFGENFAKKVRKHIDQVRNRGPMREAIPSPGRGGIERVQQIILDRVAQAGEQQRSRESLPWPLKMVL